MHSTYGDNVAFFVVYIREAHPSDAWQLPVNVKDDVVYASPSDGGQRVDLANVCVTRLGIKLPAIVDRFDDATDTAYSGWPDRLYVIDRDGRIAYKSAPGPFGFKPAEVERVLADLTAAGSSGQDRP
jgi:type I thyroxine 5'-deiodinase